MKYSLHFSFSEAKMRIPNSEYSHSIMRFSFPKEKYVVINDFLECILPLEYIPPSMLPNVHMQLAFLFLGEYVSFLLLLEHAYHPKILVYLSVRTYFFYFTQIFKNTCI